ncbi:MAG: FHA domain-containing protein [Acidimicrobiales bacterium]
MLHLTHNLVKGPRPTLGFIVFDDGSTFGLDRPYLIGREPVAPTDSGAELLILHDNNETLSRTHAELRLVDWGVQLLDLESTNGTYIWDQSFSRWNQLAPGHPVELNSGDTVALGRRTFVFESVSQN